MSVAVIPDPAPDTWGKRFNSYGALVVTIFVFGLFYLGLILSSKYADLPAPASNLLETVKALAMIAAGYWLGSSNSSQKKDDTNAALGAALATSAPVAPVTTTTTVTPPPGGGAATTTTVTQPPPSSAADPTAEAQAAVAANPVPPPMREHDELLGLLTHIIHQNGHIARQQEVIMATEADLAGKLAALKTEVDALVAKPAGIDPASLDPIATQIDDLTAQVHAANNPPAA